MAGTSAVVEAVTKLGGMPYSRASKLAKAAMQSGYVPKSGKGGGERNTAHWFDPAITFYAFSAAVAEPTTLASTLVPIFAGAEFVGRSRERLISDAGGITVRGEQHYDTRRPDNALLEIFTGSERGVSTFVDRGDLSQVFQIVLRALAEGQLSVEDLRASDLQFFFTIAGPDSPRVSVQFDLPNGDRVMDLYRPAKQSSLLPETDNLFDRSFIRRTAQIGPDLLIILADLLRDSLQRTGRILLPPDGDQSSGGKEKGAVSSEATPSRARSEDEPTAAKRGRTMNQSSVNSCKPTLGECVCPGDVSGLELTTTILPKRTHSDDREWNSLAA